MLKLSIPVFLCMVIIACKPSQKEKANEGTKGPAIEYTLKTRTKPNIAHTLTFRVEVTTPE